VLFAEAGKDSVDILISLLTLPLGTIARLVAKKCDMGPLKIASLSSLKLVDPYHISELKLKPIQMLQKKASMVYPFNPSSKYG